ncbi:MAG: KEOPS complex subunit Pcc1 [Candidatus Bathyarchaeia archaeon]
MQGRGNACELRVRFELPRDLAMALAQALSPDCKRLPKGLRVEVRAKGNSIEASLRARDAPSLLNAAEDMFRCTEAASGALKGLARLSKPFLNPVG